MEEKKTIKVSLGTVICIVIIILLIVVLFGMWYYYNYINKDVSNTNNVVLANEQKDVLNNESTNKEQVNNNLTEKEKLEVEEYLSKIYPFEAMNQIEMPEFTKIENVKEEEWIWSKAIVDASGVGSSRGEETEIASVDEINKSAKKLFGNNIGKFPVDKIEELCILKIGDGYKWIGQNASIPDVAFYKIKSINKEDNIYNIEIAEYVVHSWTDGTKILDNDGNTLKQISEDDMPYDEKAIEEYVTENINKLDAKILKIQFDESSSQYHIISSVSK